MARTAADIEAEIAEVSAAISKVLVAEEYQTPQNMRLRRSKLSDLREHRNELESQLARLTGQNLGGGRIVAFPAREDGYESV